MVAAYKYIPHFSDAYESLSFYFTIMSFVLVHHIQSQ